MDGSFGHAIANHACGWRTFSVSVLQATLMAGATKTKRSTHLVERSRVKWINYQRPMEGIISNFVINRSSQAHCTKACTHIQSTPHIASRWFYAHGKIVSIWTSTTVWNVLQLQHLETLCVHKKCKWDSKKCLAATHETSYDRLSENWPIGTGGGDTAFITGFFFAPGVETKEAKVQGQWM